MKNGTVEGISGKPDGEQLALINKFTRRNLSEDEVFVFSVTLCDNEVDRDFERFTDNSLETLKDLFVGKTGIFDHSHRAENQCARIFRTEVVSEPDRKTKAGDEYRKLKAWAYTVRSDKNKDFILDIDAGIKKEVSVGCATAKRVCSVCGNDSDTCMHRRGRYYTVNGQKKLCFFELENPTDAYEWSFVAVPAQPAAGVTKSFSKKGKTTMNIDELMKRFETEDETVLTKAQADELRKEFSLMKSLSNAAGEYLNEQKRLIIKNVCENIDQNSREIIITALDKISPQEMFKLYCASQKDKDEIAPQLRKKSKKTQNPSNRNFIV